jgi:hypothetical protein
MSNDNDSDVDNDNDNDNDKQTIVGLFGVGLDNKDGHHRITRAEDMVLLGGSEETHEAMQALAVSFGEALRQRGKRLQDVSVDEVMDLLRKAYPFKEKP